MCTIFTQYCATFAESYYDYFESNIRRVHLALVFLDFADYFDTASLQFTWHCGLFWVIVLRVRGAFDHVRVTDSKSHHKNYVMCWLWGLDFVDYFSNWRGRRVLPKSPKKSALQVFWYSSQGRNMMKYLSSTDIIGGSDYTMITFTGYITWHA